MANPHTNQLAERVSKQRPSQRVRSMQRKGREIGTGQLVIGYTLAGVLALTALWFFQAPPDAEEAGASTLMQEAAVATPAAAAEQSPIEFCVETLTTADQLLAGIPDMQAVFLKQERLEGVLGELNRVELKVRHEPLSAYMKWQTKPAGREVLWQANANDGMLLVQAGGWQKMLLPVLKIDPNGDQAMAASRYPISQIGIWNMTARLLKSATAGLKDDELETKVDEVLAQGDRLCHRFTLTHPEKTASAAYHKLVIYVDQELKVPVGCELYDWPTAEGKPVLLESYLYIGLKLDVGLTDKDFDQANPAYEFVAKE